MWFLEVYLDKRKMAVGAEWAVVKGGGPMRKRALLRAAGRVISYHIASIASTLSKVLFSSHTTHTGLLWTSCKP